MRILHGFDDLPQLGRPVVTVGSFDGVHAGHRQILTRLRHIAHAAEEQSVVVTFSPHPRHVLEQGCTMGLLSTPEEKALLLEELGMDNLVVVPFTREFSRMPYGDFVAGCLVSGLGMGTLVAGYNHHLGRDKQGSGQHLATLAKELGFELVGVQQYIVGSRGRFSTVGVGGEKVSSTLIREYVQAGDLARAEKCLTQPYFLIGGVSSRGSDQMDMEHGIEIEPGDPCKLLPPAGEYRVLAGEVGHPSRVSNRAPGVLKITASGKMTLRPEQAVGGGEIFKNDRLMIVFDKK